MSIQALVTAPVGIVKQWLNYDEEGNRQHLGAILPPGDLMPGTRKYSGREACHINWQGTADDLKADLHQSMTLIAAQEFTLIWDIVYDEEGNEVFRDGPHGVYQPVPATFVNYLEDIVTYDENGVETGRERPQPGVPLHTFAGSDQWVWE